MKKEDVPCFGITTKSRSGQNPEEQHAEFDKIQNGQNPEFDKIQNGQNPENDKIQNGQNPIKSTCF